MDEHARASRCWPALEEARRSADSARRKQILSAYVELLKLGRFNVDDPMVLDFFEMLCAYEFCLFEKNGKNTAAVYTRRKIKAKGIESFCVDVLNKPSTLGLRTLIGAGYRGFTVEALVVKHADRFSADAVGKAAYRMERC